MATKAQIHAHGIVERKLDAFHRKARSLLGHVHYNESAGTLAHIEGKTADAFAAEVASHEPVGAAVHTMKADAIADAETRARETIERVAQRLEEHGWDIHAVAPYPRRNMSRYDHQRALARYTLYHAVTEGRAGHRYTGIPGAPRYVQIAEARVDKYIDEARDRAAADYDAFICKLVGKLGAGVVDASIQGNHIWGSSILTIERESGATERWHTQQITNFSKLGNAYAQWPTRRMR